MPTTLKKISFLTLLTYGFLLGALFIYTYFAYYGIEELIPTSPDENQTLFFTQQLSNKGTLIYVNPLNQVFSEKIFAPRNVAQVDEKTVPRSFLGYFIITSFFYNIHESLLIFISPFFAV